MFIEYFDVFDTKPVGLDEKPANLTLKENDVPFKMLLDGNIMKRFVEN